MDRVQLLAIGLAVAMLGAWLWMMPHAPPPRPAEGSVPAGEAAAPAPRPESSATPRVTSQTIDRTRQDITQPVETRTLQNDALRLIVSGHGGRIISARLLNFPDRVGSEHEPVELVTLSQRGALIADLGPSEPLSDLENQTYRVEESGAQHVILAASRDGAVIRQRLEIDPEGYGARLQVELENGSQSTLTPEFSLVWDGAERPPGSPDEFQKYSLVVDSDGSVHRRPVGAIGSTGFFGALFGSGEWTGDEYNPPVEWAGIDSQYFLSAGIPENPREARASELPLGRGAGRTTLSYPVFEVPPGHRVERLFRLYFGPKMPAAVAAVDPRLDRSLEVGWTAVRPLVDLFTFTLRWTHDHIVGNYGVAIILLTFVLRLATFPLTQKSMRSMKRFSAIAPEMKKLQEKYKDDRDRLQQEMMALYRRKGMNPLTALGGGCVPMLIQFPFLIALYFALQASIELRHAPFVFWIRDLSAPEHFLDVFGIPLRPLPLLMGGSMVLQQYLTPAAGQDPQQRQMMMWMSVFFVFLFYQFPSGLVLYWLVSNVLGILQQLLVNRQREVAAATS